jgi:hypothetical protein
MLVGGPETELTRNREDNIKMILKILGWDDVYCIQLARDRTK